MATNFHYSITVDDLITLQAKELWHAHLL